VQKNIILITIGFVLLFLSFGGGWLLCESRNTKSLTDLRDSNKQLVEANKSLGNRITKAEEYGRQLEVINKERQGTIVNLREANKRQTEVNNKVSYELERLSKLNEEFKTGTIRSEELVKDAKDSLGGAGETIKAIRKLLNS